MDNNRTKTRQGACESLQKQKSGSTLKLNLNLQETRISRLRIIDLSRDKSGTYFFPGIMRLTWNTGFDVDSPYADFLFYSLLI